MWTNYKLYNFPSYEVTVTPELFRRDTIRIRRKVKMIKKFNDLNDLFEELTLSQLAEPSIPKIQRLPVLGISP
jgi:hypothetical protein